jgi:carbon-monoxide dehydrogenase medium subunit
MPARVVIGAMTTHAAVAASADVREAIPALAELAGGIGDQPWCATWAPSAARWPTPTPPPATRPPWSALGATIHTEQPRHRRPTPSSPACTRPR